MVLNRHVWIHLWVQILHCMYWMKFSTILQILMLTMMHGQNGWMGWNKHLHWSQARWYGYILPNFHATMEGIQATERHAIMVLHHDVEHWSIVNLLKDLEGTWCLLLLQPNLCCRRTGYLLNLKLKSSSSSTSSATAILVSSLSPLSLVTDTNWGLSFHRWIIKRFPSHRWTRSSGT